MQASKPRRAGHSRRVFFALWPDEPVRRTLAALADSVHAECGGRQVRAANIHLTLVFVGNIAPERVAELERLAGALAAPAFEFAIDSLQYWRHNRVVFAGMSEIPAALGTLVDGLSASLRDAGFTLETRPYRPHITLARNAQRAPSSRVLEPLAWNARDFALIESRPGGASSYETLARWPLAR